MRREKRACLWAWGGFLVVLAIALIMAGLNQSQLFGQGMFDSYTLQALAWREGRMDLPKDYPTLELAEYGGRVFVSFPPVPTVPVWILTFFFNDQVPSGLVAFAYFLLCYPAAYALGRRWFAAPHAAAFAVFILLGGSVLDLGVSAIYFSGGVWYQAQLLGLLLTLLAFLGATDARRFRQGLGVAALALAVGCRPFQAVYFPYFLWLLYMRQSGKPLARIRAMIPYGIAPFCIALAYMGYNMVRFGNPLEFGHSYLPEFSTEGGVQFSLLHIPGNLMNLLRPPYFADMGELVFPITLGFAVYLTNPLLTSAAASLHRREPGDEDWFLIGLATLHLLALLSHRTLGGWQYGSRYLCDLIPVLLVLRGRSGRAPGVPEYAWMGLAVAFNLWGTHAFHVISQLYE
ncbi:MAG TPA: hypothetical protein PKE04_01565 [Clostridia bacterium]|nr:hypothetical protein [Clostridia bacterium]